jgi:hypothetical protein
MRHKLIGALALSLLVLLGVSATAGAQDCTGASPSNTSCGPNEPPARVLSASASKPAVAAAATTKAAPSALAFTGSDAGQLALVGGAAVALGLVLRSRGRARAQHT